MYLVCTLQRTATHCNALQRTATHILLPYNRISIRYTWYVHCNALQHTATHCNALQHSATHNLLPYNRISIRSTWYVHEYLSLCVSLSFSVSLWRRQFWRENFCTYYVHEYNVSLYLSLFLSLSFPLALSLSLSPSLSLSLSLSISRRKHTRH